MKNCRGLKVTAALVIAIVALTGSLTACASEGPTSPSSGGAKKSCDSSYPSTCIPPKSEVGDLDCKDVSAKRFKVVGADSHGFDRDNDGIGCES